MFVFLKLLFLLSMIVRDRFALCGIKLQVSSDLGKRLDKSSGFYVMYRSILKS